MPSAEPGEVSCSRTHSDGGACSGVAFFAARHDFRQSEIQNFRVPALGNKNVRRLDVAVDDAFRMRCFERFGDFHRQIQQQPHFQWPVRDAVLQRGAFQKLHRNKRLRIVLADFVNRADVWMIQRRGGARFTAESLERLRVAGQIFRKKFQRDEAAQLRVFSFVDNAHATTAQFFHDAVVGNNLFHVRFSASEPVCYGVAEMKSKSSWTASVAVAFAVAFSYLAPLL